MSILGDGKSVGERERERTKEIRSNNGKRGESREGVIRMARDKAREEKEKAKRKRNEKKKGGK